MSSFAISAFSASVGKPSERFISGSEPSCAERSSRSSYASVSCVRSVPPVGFGAFFFAFFRDAALAFDSSFTDFSSLSLRDSAFSFSRSCALSFSSSAFVSASSRSFSSSDLSGDDDDDGGDDDALVAGFDLARTELARSTSTLASAGCSLGFTSHRAASPDRCNFSKIASHADNSSTAAISDSTSITLTPAMAASANMRTLARVLGSSIAESISSRSCSALALVSIASYMRAWFSGDWNTSGGGEGGVSASVSSRLGLKASTKDDLTARGVASSSASTRVAEGREGTSSALSPLAV